jgi:hypothetical protein
MQTTVTSWVTVEAETVDEAAEEAYMTGTPGLMHLDHTYPDEGDCEIPDWFYTEAEPID